MTTPNVGTWNVEFSNSDANIRAGLSALVKAGMDVIGCQELSNDAKWAMAVKHMASLGYEWGGANNACPIFVGGDWTIAKVGNEKVTSGGDKLEASSAGAGSAKTGYKSVTWAQIKHKDGSRALVANNHIVPSIESGGKLVNPLRLAWYQKQIYIMGGVIADAIKDKIPVFVTGDFNQDYDKAAQSTVVIKGKTYKGAVLMMRELGLSPCWASTKARRTVESKRTIDYVWHTAGIRVRKVTILPNFTSDHNAVACDLTDTDDDPEPVEVSMAYSPKAISDAYKYIEKNLGRPVKNGGIYANKPGYHNSRAGNRPTDYSVADAPADKRGDKDAASALDITPVSAETQRWLTARIMAWMKGDDPRAWPVREFFGSLDSKNVTGWSRWRGKVVGADSSHLWHIHLSFYREYATDADAMLGVAELICGVPLSQSKTKHATKAPVVTPKPPVVVAPSKPDVKPTPAEPTPVYLDLLKEGSKDSTSVLKVQEALVKLGAKNIAPTGDFGPGTTEAVKEFQRTHVTGVLSEAETAKLFKLASIPVVIEKES